MNVVEKLNKLNLRSDIPTFRAGDTVKVFVKVKEGEKERIQIFQGVVISRKRGTVNAAFTVRKVSYGVGVERVFPLHSPSIEKIELVSVGKVRRSKLYYLRDLSGKAARITSEIGGSRDTKPQNKIPAEKPAEVAEQAKTTN